MPTFNPYYHVGSAYGNEDFRFVQTEPVDLGQRTDGNVWRERYWTDSGEPVDDVIREKLGFPQIVFQTVYRNPDGTFKPKPPMP